MRGKLCTWIKGQLFSAPLASLLESRTVTLALIGIAILQLGFVALGLDIWQCPIKATLGFPCPGCGLSSALVLLVQGQWHAALDAHAFAPLFLVMFVLMGAVAVLPESLHHRIVHRIAELEHRSGVITIALLGLIVYWGLRLFRLV